LKLFLQGALYLRAYMSVALCCLDRAVHKFGETSVSEQAECALILVGGVYSNLDGRMIIRHTLRQAR